MILMQAQRVHSSVDDMPFAPCWQQQGRIKHIGTKEPSQDMVALFHNYNLDETPYAVKAARTVWTCRNPNKDRQGMVKQQIQ